MNDQQDRYAAGTAFMLAMEKHAGDLARAQTELAEEKDKNALLKKELSQKFENFKKRLRRAGHVLPDLRKSKKKEIQEDSASSMVLRRTKRKTAPTGKPAGVKTRKKRVAVSELKSAVQAQKRREDFADEVFAFAAALAEEEKIDDITKIRIEFAGDVEPMELRFPDPQPEEDVEEGELCTVEISEKDRKAAIMAKLMRLVAVCDRKNISCRAWRSMAAEEDELTRATKLGSARRSLNDDIASRCGLQFNAAGADVDVKMMLAEVIKLRQLDPAKEKKWKIVFAGDGRSVLTKHHSLALYMFLLNEGHKTQKHEHIYQLGIYDCKESYEGISTYARRVIDGLNGLVESGHAGIPVELFVSGDMKFINIVSGLYGPGCKSRRTCFYCPCTFKDRKKNMCTHAMDPDRLKLGKKTKKYPNGKLPFDSKFPPLFPSVKPCNYVIDSLHLLLRTTDVFLNLCISEVIASHTAVHGGYREQCEGV